ncbi:MAG: hypothetical protein QOE36_3341 [Gaiellaceae bacterium]|nr:hypothetical protein [Gaiellaceae bacterium]
MPLEVILERAHEAFVSIGEDGRVLEWNAEAARTFGWPAVDAVGAPLRDLIIPDRFRALHDAGLARFLQTGDGPLVNRRVEVRALHRSGNEFPVELTITPIQGEDDRWTFHAFIHDISDRHRANELQARLATIVEHSVDAIVSRDRHGAITSWNPAAERLYGWSAEEMLGGGPRVLEPPDRLGEADQLFRRALGGEAIVEFETIRVCRDGSPVDVAITLSPIRDEDGEVSEVSMVIRNVSARKQAERQLRETAELKAQFVAVASHELRTPLTSIGGFAKTLLARWDELDDEQRLGFVQIVGEQSDRLTRLVDDVLLLSRIEGQARREKAGVTSVTPVAAAVLKELDAGEAVKVDIEPGLAAAVDSDDLHRMLLNLVGNALTHGAPPIELRAAAAGAELVVSVSDAGAGVPPELVPELFSAFTQDVSRSGGAGLGLAIVRSLAESYGGQVAYGTGGGRTTFSVRLPAAHGKP